ncbi:Fe-Mn family superoxide dismutase [Dyella sp. BiH032]|uniref:superoxide dismutase n=1 Tax=Dyella sp. BiH032 TaxID=3075430 RepID=UPI0028931391|nr:Fe-Mn family superoxide dismutase [Dyella sp. BiH032]WNL45197.1 Fe-Mn family superoxide dismutase [Dyella sp. BiH032]
MAIELLPLPYELHGLAPHLSAETLEYHYGKHHRAYVTNLNALIAGTEFEGMQLEEIVRRASGPIFNNAAQAWNHSFYWNSMSPRGGGAPQGRLADAIARDFGSFEAFKEAFAKSGTTLFGSGWTWLVQRPDGKLAIVNTANADTPLTGEDRPLLVADVWEHAYYIDYRNARPNYLQAFWQLAHWEFAADHLA